MKKLIFILLFIYSIFSNAQSIEIDYNHIVKFEDHITNLHFKLIQFASRSSYFLEKSEFTNLSGNETILSNENATFIAEKDHLRKVIIYNQPIASNIFYIKESLPLQKWQLINEEKAIKSLKCKKAITTFRGRNYTAWYTEELPVIGGPWKFDGLPGLILQVASDDGVLFIEVTKIEKQVSSDLPELKYNPKKLISWQEYCDKFHSFIKRIQDNFKADSDPDVTYDLKINTIEVISEH